MSNEVELIKSSSFVFGECLSPLLKLKRGYKSMSKQILCSSGKEMQEL